MNDSKSRNNVNEGGKVSVLTTLSDKNSRWSVGRAGAEATKAGGGLPSMTPGMCGISSLTTTPLSLVNCPSSV